MRTVTSPAGNRRGFFVVRQSDRMRCPAGVLQRTLRTVLYTMRHGTPFSSPRCAGATPYGVGVLSGFFRCSGAADVAVRHGRRALRRMRRLCGLPAASCHVLCWRQYGCVRVPPAVMHMPSACLHLQPGTDVFSVIPATVLPRAPSARAYLRVDSEIGFQYQS